jgi:hypothetical protein
MGLGDREGATKVGGNWNVSFEELNQGGFLRRGMNGNRVTTNVHV